MSEKKYANLGEAMLCALQEAANTVEKYKDKPMGYDTLSPIEQLGAHDALEVKDFVSSIASFGKAVDEATIRMLDRGFNAEQVKKILKVVILDTLTISECKVRLF